MLPSHATIRRDFQIALQMINFLIICVLSIGCLVICPCVQGQTAQDDAQAEKEQKLLANLSRKTAPELTKLFGDFIEKRGIGRSFSTPNFGYVGKSVLNNVTYKIKGTVDTKLVGFTMKSANISISRRGTKTTKNLYDEYALADLADIKAHEASNSPYVLNERGFTTRSMENCYILNVSFNKFISVKYIGVGRSIGFGTQNGRKTIGTFAAHPKRRGFIIEFPTANDLVYADLILTAIDNVLKARITLSKATTLDAESVAVDYKMNEEGGSVPVRFSIYRSGQPIVIDSSVKVGDGELSDPQYLSPGDHQDVQLPIKTDLRPNPRLPYVVVVAERGKSKETAYFHKRLLGVVVHGFDNIAYQLDFLLGDSDSSANKILLKTPSWEDALCSDLMSFDGYNNVIPFDWEANCILKQPGRAAQAGHDLYREICSKSYIQQPSHPGDTVDIHFIGHSRGTVVVSQALQDFVGRTLPALKGSYVEVTLLDAHPANETSNNLLSPSTPDENTTLSDAVITRVQAFQKAAQDGEIVLPANANIKRIEVFFQRTPVGEFTHSTKNIDTSPTEGVVNLWGISEDDHRISNEAGVDIKWFKCTSALLGTEIGKAILVGHLEICDYYRKTVVDIGLLHRMQQ